MRIALIVLVIAASVAGLVLTAPEAPSERQQARPVSVQTLRVDATNLEPVRTVAGDLRAARKAVLRFEVSGQVTERRAEPGQTLEQGGVLLKLDDADYRAALDEAEARLARQQLVAGRDRRLLELARNNVRLQDAEVKRLQRLGQSSLASASQLGEARQRLQQLEAEVERLQYGVDAADIEARLLAIAVDRARRNLARTRIRMPFAGRVDAMAVQPGDVVTVQQVAAKVIDDRELDFHAEVPLEVAAALRLGDVATIRVDGRRIEGRIVALGQEPDRRTFTWPLRIRVPGGGLMPGQLARAELRLPPLHEVLTVPLTAVLREDGAAYLFVVTEGRLQRRRVSLGRRIGDRQVIADGLQAGEVVVVADVAGLADGQPVVVKKSMGVRESIYSDPH